jgi:hypothetical protein
MDVPTRASYVLLLVKFSKVRPPEEAASAAD